MAERPNDKVKVAVYNADTKNITEVEADSLEWERCQGIAVLDAGRSLEVLTRSSFAMRCMGVHNVMSLTRSYSDYPSDTTEMFDAVTTGTSRMYCMGTMTRISFSGDSVEHRKGEEEGEASSSSSTFPWKKNQVFPLMGAVRCTGVMFDMVEASSSSSKSRLALSSYSAASTAVPSVMTLSDERDMIRSGLMKPKSTKNNEVESFSSAMTKMAEEFRLNRQAFVASVFRSLCTSCSIPANHIASTALSICSHPLSSGKNLAIRGGELCHRASTILSDNAKKLYERHSDDDSPPPKGKGGNEKKG